MRGGIPWRPPWDVVRSLLLQVIGSKRRWISTQVITHAGVLPSHPRDE